MHCPCTCTDWRGPGRGAAPPRSGRPGPAWTGSRYFSYVAAQKLQKIQLPVHHLNNNLIQRGLVQCAYRPSDTWVLLFRMGGRSAGHTVWICGRKMALVVCYVFFAI